MRILPVIDLLGGLVVRGIGGRRGEYKPIVSRIAADARPATVASAFRELGFKETYVADLDAIAGHAPAWHHYAAIADAGLRIWLDAGLSSLERAVQLSRFHIGGLPLHRIVVGLETLESIDLLEQLVVSLDNRLVFGLDLHHGTVRTRIVSWQRTSPLEIAEAAWRIGVRRFLVLDLADVGESRGTSTTTLCRQICALDAQTELIAGGGVRNQADLTALADAGCHAALVASALHDGCLVGCPIQ